ncbi:MAG: GNAT family N-acetyltransferase [Spirochaetales bacterium]|nr:GNAT family N-acetyltransferase [Candidatus Physcosoma equi]
MAKKEFKVSTKRLVLKPMSQVAMGRLADATEDEELKKAYLSMAEKAMEAEDPYWYCAWGIYEKKTGTLVGNFSYMGPQEYASVEIRFYIEEEHRGKGYAEEALRAMMDTALYGDHGIYFIDAVTSSSNEASQHVLEKLGFVSYDGEDENKHYVYSKPQHSMLALGISIGLCFGSAFGIALKSYGTGMPLGLALGVAYGLLLDSSGKKRRAEAETLRAMKNSDEE